MPAYDDAYLLDAMENLGEMTDSAVSLLKVPLATFWPLFAASTAAREVSKGSPYAIEGRSGLELAVGVCEQAGLPIASEVRRSAIDEACASEGNTGLEGLTRAYWCGWILGYYQWRANRTFAEIARSLPIGSVERMYPTFHEESEERFCEAADEIIAAARKPCGLKRQRAIVGLSQAQLARRSGVGLRAIQQYEQGAKDIAKASYDRIERLAQALHCEPRLLMSEAPSRYEYGVVVLP